MSEEMICPRHYPNQCACRLQWIPTTASDGSEPKDMKPHVCWCGDEMCPIRGLMEENRRFRSALEYYARRDWGGPAGEALKDSREGEKENGV